ncbi:aliphatic sulfonates import ATP-binding protein SsuB [Candidatus Phycosocius bacilliformis]|uniref:Aliphatic sulfonates import ATP-binding protein SsuB n=1 Tax=Candidatus Phycosocius bacilliformis TaxID=1445552 RepID=A0A2P2EAA1_9PROT|nr:ABC transporter ATP-binding protein [Candidatus Phycosocius bacilliformis]GBF57982.1 aliphatic sulfonates import ATP-binding protein SsuB [Candidatus Phycosocius bacilliformis]
MSAQPTGGSRISLKQVQKAFGSNIVLQGIDLEIPEGQFVSIVGKSGCGKSTLLRLMIGLDAPTGGTLDAPALKAQAARIVFQEPRLLPWASVQANVAVGLGASQTGPEANKQAEAILDEVGLKGREGLWPSQLSGGMRQRVALARALVSRPTLLALDEPLGALDALTRIDMQALLEGVWQDLGFTALLVTHDVGEAVALGDRVILIDQGRVALDLTIDLPRPRRRGTPEFAALEGQILDTLFGDDPRAREAH